jgi:translation initiation factor 5B
MTPKRSNNNKKDDEDDWEALLEAEITLSNEKVTAETSGTTFGGIVTSNKECDEDKSAIEGTKKVKKKKKKATKKNVKGGEEQSSNSSSPMSAVARRIFEQQQRNAAQEAFFKAAQEKAERETQEEIERETAEIKRIEDEKERKRKARQDKIEKQKANGTFRTKAEKEKAKKAAIRLEQLKALGMGSTGSVASLPSAPRLIAEPNTIPPPIVNPDSSAGSIQAIQMDSESDDDWETAADSIAEEIARVPVGVAVNEEEEDVLEIEKRIELEKLRRIGIERAKRDEDMRVQRNKEEESQRMEIEFNERQILMRREASRERRRVREDAALAARSPKVLRSPISCIMGHVDTGKTKLLDKIRHSNVQEGEAGGITQQIGATAFSKDTLQQQTYSMQKLHPFDVELPGLLMIDTPGHESFTNLRSRGSSLCDIAVLVIDLMHGLEPQTVESLNMLRRLGTPFIVALNKLDRCYGWKSVGNCPSQAALANQDMSTIAEFNSKMNHVVLQLSEQGINAELYWNNKSFDDTISLVPTSAHTGEGIPDLLYNIIIIAQTRKRLVLQAHMKLTCTVLEVKVVEGFGHTIDVVLVNGEICEGDNIVVSTMEGPVLTQVRALVTPPPNRESRVNKDFVHHQFIRGTVGVKIVAADVGRAIAGTTVMVLHPEDDEEEVMEDCQSDLTQLLKSLEMDARGVLVHASTLGALEALLQFLREECEPKIPVSHIVIGPIYKKDIMRAALAHDKGSPEYATILAFDVKVDSDATSMATEMNVRIFSADIIYHLFDQFTVFMNSITAERKADAEKVAVFPCVIKVLPHHIFNKKDPIIMGVQVLEGTLRVGTPLTICSSGFTDIGKVIAIENNQKEVLSAKRGSSVSIKIRNESNPNITYGRHFDDQAPLYSKISRRSIDALKEFFKADVTKEEWHLIIKLKKTFLID